MDVVGVVAITDQVPTQVVGTDAFQEMHIIQVCLAITKHHYVVTRAEALPGVMKEAFYIASTGRPGPVIVDVPKDVQNKTLAVEYDPPMNLPGYRPDRRPSRQELEAVLR